MSRHGRTEPRSFVRTLRWTRLMVLLAGGLLVAPALHAQGNPLSIEADTLVRAEIASGDASLFPVTSVLPPGSHGSPFVMAHAAQTDPSVLTADGGLNVGTNAALMSVGVAAIGIGLLIGGDAGTAVAVTGGGVALVGLYRFVR